jgi:hypothetical protein
VASIGVTKWLRCQAPQSGQAAQAQNSSPEGLSVPMVARTATFARHQSGWTFNGKRTTQTINLASSQTQQPARSLNRQTIV